MEEETQKKEEQKISAGAYDLNKWLFGGYDKDITTTIYGPAGSGKTNFCLLVAVSQAKKNNKVIYIDTEGGFSIERVKQIAGENYQSVLNNILLLKPVSFKEQEEAFKKILEEIKGKEKIGLIVIDGMTMLYRLELAEASKSKDEAKVREINSKLASQMRILNEITRKKNIPIIITNQVYSEFLSKEDFEAGKEKSVSMVGGDILKYWSKCIIELKILPNSKRKAVLRKHRSLKESEFYFSIINEGIKKSFRLF